MKTSELIKLLKTSLKERGDLEIRLPTDLDSEDGLDDSAELAGILRIGKFKNDRRYFLLCNNDMLDAVCY